MWVCACTCVLYMLTCVYVCTRVHVGMCTCVHVYMCTCVHVCMCTCVYVNMCTCVHVGMCTCVHVYMCACGYGYECLQSPWSAGQSSTTTLAKPLGGCVPMLVCCGGCGLHNATPKQGAGMQRLSLLIFRAHTNHHSFKRLLERLPM